MNKVEILAGLVKMNNELKILDIIQNTDIKNNIYYLASLVGTKYISQIFPDKDETNINYAIIVAYMYDLDLDNVLKSNSIWEATIGHSINRAFPKNSYNSDFYAKFKGSFNSSLHKVISDIIISPISEHTDDYLLSEVKSENELLINTVTKPSVLETTEGDITHFNKSTDNYLMSDVKLENELIINNDTTEYSSSEAVDSEYYDESIINDDYLNKNLSNMSIDEITELIKIPENLLKVEGFLLNNIFKERELIKFVKVINNRWLTLKSKVLVNTINSAYAYFMSDFSDYDTLEMTQQHMDVLKNFVAVSSLLSVTKFNKVYSIIYTLLDDEYKLKLLSDIKTINKERFNSNMELEMNKLKGTS